MTTNYYQINYKNWSGQRRANFLNALTLDEAIEKTSMKAQHGTMVLKGIDDTEMNWKITN